MTNKIERFIEYRGFALSIKLSPNKGNLYNAMKGLDGELDDGPC